MEKRRKEKDGGKKEGGEWGTHTGKRKEGKDGETERRGMRRKEEEESKGRGRGNMKEQNE